MNERKGRGIPIHYSFVLVTIGWSANVTELHINLVFSVRFERIDACFFFSSCTEETLPSSLPLPIIDN